LNISYNILITTGNNWIKINSKLDGYNSCESKPTWIDIWDECGGESTIKYTQKVVWKFSLIFLHINARK
jgi:hypothetical protein